MGLVEFTRWLRSAVLIAGALWLASLPAGAQTSIKFSLDNRSEGPAAFFLIPQDRGYFQSEQLEVTVDDGNAAIEPITRVASGTYEMGFADINALIRYRAQNPAAPVKAIFMVYNKPPYAVIGRKSRGIGEPKSLEGKRLGAPTTGSTFSAWPLFAKLNKIDTSKVTLETIARARARADAGCRPARCRARLFVPGLYRFEGSRRADRRHRADADGE